MAENETFQYGGVVFPLATSTGNSLLRDADPAVYFALDFFSFALTKYMGARYAAEATTALLKATTVVASTVPYDPSEYLDEGQFKFPLLALCRRNSLHSDKTIGFRQDESALELAYILPPMLPSQIEQVIPALNSVKAIIDHVAEKGWDPTYTPPGGAAGDVAWKLSNAGLQSIELKQSAFGQFPGTADSALVFPSIIMTLAVRERSAEGIVATAYPDFQGINLDANLQPVQGKGGVYPDVAQLAVRFPFSLLSVSPTSGTVSASTTVVLTGTGFTADCKVTFGGLPVVSSTFVNATTISCVSPIFPIATTVDVTVRNVNGQSATLFRAFSYA